MRPRGRHPGVPGAAWHEGGPRPWYPPAAPRQPPPPDGIKVRKIGATWWGQRWIAALERLSPEYARRIARGRSYARAGRVHALRVRGNLVSARVTGSRPTPYEVAITVRPLSAPVWARALAEMAREARFSALLLTAAMPDDIEQAFRCAGAALFPAASDDLETACSCPDWANPCKHVAAAHAVLGDLLDRDPFLLFELRGRTRAQVLAALRRTRARGAGRRAADIGDGTGEDGAEAVPAVVLDGADRERYERPRGSLDALRFHTGEAARPATILRQLGPPPSWSDKESPDEVLAHAYQAAGDWARRLAASS